jgi:3-isopropylmalate dehydratase small subunit
VNTITAEKEITFTLFYRNARNAGMMSTEEATAAVAQLAREEGWELKTWTVDRFGRDILASARKPAYAWVAVANRAGIQI